MCKTFLLLIHCKLDRKCSAKLQSVSKTKLNSSKIVHENHLQMVGQFLLQLSISSWHTSAKLIEIQKSSLQTRHGLHELGSHMESNHTLHGSELDPHWVLGPKKSKFGPMGPKKFAQKYKYPLNPEHIFIISVMTDVEVQTCLFGAKILPRVSVGGPALSPAGLCPNSS